MYLYHILLDGVFSDTSLCCGAFGSGTIHTNNLRCSGREYRLVDCGSTYVNGLDEDRDDWSVICYNGNL